MTDFNENCMICTKEPIGMSPQGIAILQNWHSKGHPETKTKVTGLIPPSPLGKKFPADKPSGRPSNDQTLDFIEMFVDIANASGQEDYYGRYGGEKPEKTFEQVCLEKEAQLIQWKNSAVVEELKHLPLDGLVDQCFLAFRKRLDDRIKDLSHD